MIWPINEAKHNFLLCCQRMYLSLHQTFTHAFVPAVSEKSLTNADIFPHFKCENSDVIDDNWETKKDNSAVDSLKVFHFRYKPEKRSDFRRPCNVSRLFQALQQYTETGYVSATPKCSRGSANTSCGLEILSHRN